eukprot:jgi/Botrbrau1/20080/Bobra.200_1s0083.1
MAEQTLSSSLLPRGGQKFAFFPALGQFSAAIRNGGSFTAIQIGRTTGSSENACAAVEARGQSWSPSLKDRTHVQSPQPRGESCLFSYDHIIKFRLRMRVSQDGHMVSHACQLAMS